jgi:hypothetical protein
MSPSKMPFWPNEGLFHSLKSRHNGNLLFQTKSLTILLFLDSAFVFNRSFSKKDVKPSLRRFAGRCLLAKDHAFKNPPAVEWVRMLQSKTWSFMAQEKLLI